MPRPWWSTVRSRLSYDQDQGEAVMLAASNLINDQSLASIPELVDAIDNSVQC